MHTVCCCQNGSNVTRHQDGNTHCAQQRSETDYKTETCDINTVEKSFVGITDFEKCSDKSNADFPTSRVGSVNWVTCSTKDFFFRSNTHCSRLVDMRRNVTEELDNIEQHVGVLYIGSHGGCKHEPNLKCHPCYVTSRELPLEEETMRTAERRTRNQMQPICRLAIHVSSHRHGNLKHPLVTTWLTE